MYPVQNYVSKGARFQKYRKNKKNPSILKQTKDTQKGNYEDFML